MKKHLIISVMLIVCAYVQAQNKPNTVLNQGQWYKFETTIDGVYKISYEDLEINNVITQSTPSVQIGIFGMSAGMLDENNFEFYENDIMELPIQMYDGDDDMFDPGDYFLFYGESPDQWIYQNETDAYPEFQQHLYSNTMSYFITLTEATGLRIENRDNINLNPDLEVDYYFQHQVYEDDFQNLLQIGRTWYGEDIAVGESDEYIFHFANRIPEKEVFMRTHAAAMSDQYSNMRFWIDEELVSDLSFPPSTDSRYTYAYANKQELSLIIDGGETFTINSEYDSPGTVATAWLDYIEVSAACELIFTGPQMRFDFPKIEGNSGLVKMILESPTQNFEIWKVDDVYSIQKQSYEEESGAYCFTQEFSFNDKFIVFDDSEYLEIENFEAIENQNLHGADVVNLMIITSDALKSAAEDYASFRAEDLSVNVVTVDKIYNEYSSGVQDITAIRNFVKDQYSKDQNHETFKYVLLYGAASYDYLDRIENNSNHVPEYLSETSLSLAGSYGIDDYYGQLFPIGASVNDYQIIIGRVPARNLEQANIYNRKVEDYLSITSGVESWKNRVVFAADDADKSEHMEQTEEIIEKFEGTIAELATKVYIDQYEQIELSNDQQECPEANHRLIQELEEGCLIFNYIGHGSTFHYAHENLMTSEDLSSFESPNAKVFISASCDDGKMNNPEISPILMDMMFDETHGNVVSVANSGLAFSLSNYGVLMDIYDEIAASNFKISIGEAFQSSKLEYNELRSAYHLYGDPSLNFARPKFEVIPTLINDLPFSEWMDTIAPGEEFTLKGVILDENGVMDNSYSGVIEGKAYFPAYEETTLGDGFNEEPMNYMVLDSIFQTVDGIVQMGEFEISFRIPNDFLYVPDEIKLCLMANNGVQDAIGIVKGLQAGGATTGFKEQAGSNINMKVYPGFVTSDVNISFSGFEDSLVLLSVYDLAGQELINEEINQLTDQETRIKKDLSGLGSGMYILRLTDGLSSKSVRIVKK